MACSHPINIRLFGRLRASIVIALLAVFASSCVSSHTRTLVPAGTAEPDKFLFDRGQTALDSKKWLTAREFYKQLVETYTQSPYRPDAKLAIGDTYLGEGGSANLVLGINEFQEFLQFYPTNPRADYAQYKMGLAHFRQMRAAERDQTETRAAIKDFQTFVDKYPNSRLLPEVKEKLREARDRVDTADYNIGYYYFRVKWYPGSIDRFKALLKQDPEFTKRDAVYFYLGEALIKVKKQAEALPYYDKLVQEFEKSEFLPEAQKRIAELRAQMASK